MKIRTNVQPPTYGELVEVLVNYSHARHAVDESTRRRGKGNPQTAFDELERADNRLLVYADLVERTGAQEVKQ